MCIRDSSALSLQLSELTYQLSQEGQCVSLAPFTLENSTAYALPQLVLRADYIMGDEIVESDIIFSAALSAGEKIQTLLSETKLPFNQVRFSYEITVLTDEYRDVFSGSVCPDTQYAYDGALLKR